MIGQLILALSILVGLHEAGHMIPAKYFGMRVSRFFIGFPPTLFSRKIGETEYGIGTIPLGGFVKIEGMVDESMDTESLSKEPQEWEFRSKPAWQRLIVMLGGITVNFFLGIIIFIGLIWVSGESFIANSELKDGVFAHPTAKAIGFETGDRLVSVNGKPLERFNDALNPQFLFTSGTVYTVDRKGKMVDIAIPADMLKRVSESGGKDGFLSPAQPFSIDRVAAGSGAALGGLKPGDKILSINGQPISYFQDVRPILSEYKCCKVEIKVARAKENEMKTLQCTVAQNGTLGFFPRFHLKESTYYPGFGESIGLGFSNAMDILKFNFLGFSKVFSGEVSASQSLSGPVGIASEFFGGHFNWPKFWRSTAILSLILAFMNLLPIPALDGGHAVFLFYEILAGRPPSLRFMEWAQRIGMFLILGLMIFAFGNDFYKIFKKEPDTCKCEKTEIVLPKP
jgi:regulator of sigma E protease